VGGRLIGLVACCSEKGPTPDRADRLYRSTLFRLSAEYVRRNCPEWGILSALHGLVLPDRVIAPYDLTLADLDRAAREEWARRTRGQLLDRWPGSTFLVLAGEKYRGAVEGLGHLDPLRGLTIGRRLAWLKARLAPGGPG
jgi:hypothetical protein